MPRQERARVKEVKAVKDQVKEQEKEKAEMKDSNATITTLLITTHPAEKDAKHR